MAPTADELTNDPHPFLAKLRDAAPVHQIPLGPGMNGWLITRYEDARKALNDQRFAKGPLMGIRLGGGTPFPVEIQRSISMHMLNADPPDHTRLRRLVSAAFTARRMEGLRDRVQEITDELLDAMALKETADVIDDFAFPLPFLVICELIGVPADDRETFRTWSNTIMAGVAASGPETVEAITAMTAYVKDLVELRRSEPDDALLSGLIEASDTEDRLTGDELTSLVFLLLIAGHETTVNLIGNAIYLLLDRPAEAAALRADESLLPRAIEEVLRYESPVKTATFRMSTEDVQVGDVTIPAGSLVLISLLSAHRDGATFPDPDEFRLDRDEAQHVAFGYGVHYCIGAPLARIEGQIAIGSLLRRFPAMSPAVPLAELGWRPGILLRGLDHLPVQL